MVNPPRCGFSPAVTGAKAPLAWVATRTAPAAGRGAAAVVTRSCPFTRPADPSPRGMRTEKGQSRWSTGKFGRQRAGSVDNGQVRSTTGRFGGQRAGSVVNGRFGGQRAGSVGGGSIRVVNPPVCGFYPATTGAKALFAWLTTRNGATPQRGAAGAVTRSCPSPVRWSLLRGLCGPRRGNRGGQRASSVGMAAVAGSIRVVNPSVCGMSLAMTGDKAPFAWLTTRTEPADRSEVLPGGRHAKLPVPPRGGPFPARMRTEKGQQRWTTGSLGQAVRRSGGQAVGAVAVIGVVAVVGAVGGGRDGRVRRVRRVRAAGRSELGQFAWWTR